ncbi:Peptidase M10 serralysin C terminal family [Synechococcus sp. PCC 7335]|uniref:M10 family metallopeptidase n=1 Tax=Synechococcus sp. (strain ATCC 29403 / PCC 7335) TaxID=91464 RepID=UPI00017EC0CA|nr:M10 family metallopeptidase [Synechococcus sp. PCC 7335]EDX82722.1 Peptidase M10 serralysin C terminal family [Synechococcus sp. PCC 7335]
MTYGQLTPTTSNTATGERNIDSLISAKRYLHESKQSSGGMGGDPEQPPYGGDEPPIGGGEPPIDPIDPPDESDEPVGIKTRITYSFPDEFRDKDYESDYGGFDGFNAFNSAQKAATRSIMKMYESVANFDLDELTDNKDRDATIRLANADGTNRFDGIAGFPSEPDFMQGDVWIDSVNDPRNTNPKIGNKGYWVLMHEIGHALGLTHSHETHANLDGPMDSWLDSKEFTVMSYKAHVGGELIPNPVDEVDQPQSLMMYDIAAIQAMYGANFDTRSGNTTYTFSTSTGEMFANGQSLGKPENNTIFRTIWDGNGRDTYDFSNTGRSQSINLRPGAWSDLSADSTAQNARLKIEWGGVVTKRARGHIANALQHNDDPRSLIENAKGGGGSDTIQGNIARNHLYGNVGDDRLWGWDNNDTLDGGSEDDLLFGGRHNDILKGGPGNDILVGADPYSNTPHNEVDVLWGGADADRFVLGLASDYSVPTVGGPPANRILYDDNVVWTEGQNSYALIMDFELGIDRIQLRGDSRDYNWRSVEVVHDNQTYLGTGIYVDNPVPHRDELIGVLVGVNASQISVYDSSQFSYVYATTEF